MTEVRRAVEDHLLAGNPPGDEALFDLLAGLGSDDRDSLDRGPEDTPYGRVAVFRDPFGHRWMLNADSS